MPQRKDAVTRPVSAPKTPKSSAPNQDEVQPVSPLPPKQPVKLPVVAKATWTTGFSRQTLAALLVVTIFLFHLIGLYTFTRGFLLTRLSIPTISTPYSIDNPPPIPATHKKAIVLVIDALRTDFISPHHPYPPSPNHHGVLTLPAELAQSHPQHSLIFNSFSDPPTTTMQRLKGITTGSLPTFVDAGANFASTAIQEDSWISQLVQANKSIAFMGDDTWANLFPDSLTHSHPYDSFNVEDLHTVDNGVIEHLYPYLHSSNSSKWDVLIGHFLGVDHVGHRVGPERDTMREKLKQMDGVLRRVVRMMDNETLLIVLGDHGMDSNGNHGGDSELETAAALWLYSKGGPLAPSSQEIDLPQYTFPGSKQSLRHVNQIDLVPTLSLLLGLPIPFNNLGSIIPDCFMHNPAQLETAMRVNADQISRYISEYGDDKISGWLDGSLGTAQKLQQEVLSSAKPSTEVLRSSYIAHRTYNIDALEELRRLWAQFSVPLISLGLAIVGLNIPILIMLYTGIRNRGPAWDQIAQVFIESVVSIGGSASVLVGLLLLPFHFHDLPFVLHSALIAGAIASQATLTFGFVTSTSFPTRASLPLTRAIGPIILAAHAISFASNSFIMWEDRMVAYLLNTVTLVYLLKSLTHPTASMRLKVIILSLVFGFFVRVLSAVTVCREEQQPYCHVTFYAGSSAIAPTWVVVAIIPVGLQLPRALGLTLNNSKSLGGPARTFLGILWRGILTLNAVHWGFEYGDSTNLFKDSETMVLVKFARLWTARSSFLATIAILPIYWLTSSLCISIEKGTEQDGTEKPVTVFGFANAFGSTYLLFLLIPFALFHLVSAPMAQLTLSVILCAILAHIENIDTQRDSILMLRQFAQSSSAGSFDSTSSGAIVRPSFTDVVPLVLLGFVGFFSTGHQAVLTTIQWKAAFVGFETVTYPYSPILVVLNTWGPLLLSALAVPLLALWNISPRPQSTIPVLAHSVQLGIAFMLYHTVLAFTSALFAAWLRRHLMVWKVFAPRFMLGGVSLLMADLGILIALTIGLRVTSWKVWRTFKCESI